MVMDPRFAVNVLLRMKRRTNDEFNAVNFAVNSIQRFCYPAEPIVVQIGKTKKYICRRCNQPIRSSDCFCPSCGQRVFQKIKVVNG